ncbi:MAG: STAS domain-containing protein [Bacteroidota bacterium]
MRINLIDKDGVCHLVFTGCLTFEFARELEDRIIDAMRRYDRFRLDLSAVSEIDLCGLHLLRILDTLGGAKVETIAGSPVVEMAERRLLASPRANWLRGRRDEHGSVQQAA